MFGAHVNKSRYRKERNKVELHFTFSCTFFLDIHNARLFTITKKIAKRGIFMVSTFSDIKRYHTFSSLDVFPLTLTKNCDDLDPNLCYTFHLLYPFDDRF